MTEDLHSPTTAGPQPTPVVGASDASFEQPPGTAAGSGPAGPAGQPPGRGASRDPRGRRLRRRYRRRLHPQAAGPMTDQQTHRHHHPEHRAGDPGGLRARLAARARGDRAGQGRGDREGHQARQGRGRSGSRPASSSSSAWSILLHGFAWLAWYELVPRQPVLLGLLRRGRGAPPARRAGRLHRVRARSSRARRPRRRWPSTRPSSSRRPSSPRTRSGPSSHADPHARGDPRLDRVQPHGARALARRGCAARWPRSPTGASRSPQHQKQVLIGAAVAGFVIGGGIAAVGGLFRRRR